MSIYHDEIEIEDFEYDEETETYFYPCPCGDKFQITKVNQVTSLLNLRSCMHQVQVDQQILLFGIAQANCFETVPIYPYKSNQTHGKNDFCLPNFNSSKNQC